MLDKSRPFDTVGMKDRTYWKQDGVYYDPSSGLEVDLSAKPPVPPVKAQGLTCKLCGAVRHTPELFKEHLLAVHKDEVGPLKEEPDKNEPTAEIGTDAEARAKLLDNMTVRKLREYAEKHKIDLSNKLTRKADILEAIKKAGVSSDDD